MPRVRLTYANVVATLALFISLGGGAYAAGVVPHDSVGKWQIRTDGVGASELRQGSVDTSEVRNRSLLAEDFAVGVLRDAPAGDGSGKPGPRGEMGRAGSPGEKGGTGADGAPGVKGDDGIDGDQGPKGETGADGATGPKGETGADGATGPKGADGPAGATGEAGPPGPAVAQEFLYAYATEDQRLPGQGRVGLSSVGVATKGLTYDRDKEQIIASAAGIYEVEYTVAAFEGGTFSVAVNDTPRAEATYASNSSAPVVGHVLLTLDAGDQLALQSIEDRDALISPPRPSALAASVLIKQLG